jgi:Domain of unknown function (DUF4129)
VPRLSQSGLSQSGLPQSGLPQSGSRQSGSQTLSALEDAIHLLRAAPLSTLLCHWTGSAPFTLAVMLFWNDITQYRPSNAACVADSLALAALLAWMNCWRATFAGRLRAQLGGAPAAGASAWKMAGFQSLLGASKLVVLPVSALILFPLASTVAFYRYAAVLSSRADLSFRQVMARASKLAAIDQRQSWATLPAVAFLQVLVTLNVATALALLPQLVRMLTGYESTFSRAGISFVDNPLFIMAAVAVGWMAIDPFIQAVYCVMYFRRESLASGEDLRAGLRGLRSAALAAAALLCVFAGGAMAVEPDPLRQSIERTMQAHEYDWRLPPETAARNKPSWLVNMVDRMFHGLMWFTQHAVKAIGNLLRWIFDKLSMQGGDSGAAPTHALSTGIYVLIAVILILAGLLAVRIIRARRARPPVAGASVAVAVRLEDESVTPDRLPEDQWIEMAENCLREQNYRLALRAFYLANLAWLGRSEWIAINPGKTNREYESDLRRRAREFGEARGLFSQNLAAFERAWYGLHAVAAEDAELFRQRNGRMKAMLARPEPVAA